MEGVYREKDPWHYAKCNRHAILLGLLNQYGREGRLVEYACGEGVFTSKIPKIFRKEYLGVDISPTAIDRAMRANPDLNFRCASIEDELVRYSEEYSTIIVSDVVPYLEEPVRDWHVALIDQLKPGGVLIMTSWASAYKGACAFPYLEFQNEVDAIFLGNGLALASEGFEYESAYFVGRKK